MKVLMFGWEFPPFNRGGLGTACYGLTKALSNKNVDVTFVVPRAPDKSKSGHLKLVATDDLAGVLVKEIDSPLTAYMTSEEYEEEVSSPSRGKAKSLYGKNLFVEVRRYAAKAGAIAKDTEHDVIHAHDWMTYQAGIAAKKISRKPLVIHVHATEFDRTGGNGLHQHVYDIEREGMHEADKIIAVSNFTKNKIVEHYGVNPNKISVVHNGVEFANHSFDDSEIPLKNDHKIVLFLGRITLQKGPDYFLYAAQKVLEYDPKIMFVMAGSGDMQPAIMRKAAELGIADKMLFTGFLRGRDVHKAYQMADVYVMPSVSEPFGIAPLEAINNKTPVIISKQSGISEVLTHCLRVDFWDVHELANKIVGVLEYQELTRALRDNSALEMSKFDWHIPAQKCINVYHEAMVKNI